MKLATLQTGLLLICAATALAGDDPATTYRFRAFEVCSGCPANTGGINDEGLVGASTPTQGYVYNSRTNQAFAIPGALAISVPEDDGTIPGITTGPRGTVVPFVWKHQQVHTLPGFPGALITFIINYSGGPSVGWASLDFVHFFSFTRSADGVYTRLDYPGPGGNLGTILLGLNQRGTSVGYLLDSVLDPTGLHAVGIIRHPDGRWEQFAAPGALSTLIYAINERGTMAGGYRDTTGWHGFVSRHGSLTTVDFPGAANTVISGINNHDEIVGMRFTTASPEITPTYGFVAQPKNHD